MPRRFPIVLLWLILVALPLQGYATSAMLYCGITLGTNGTAAAAGQRLDHDSMVAHHPGPTGSALMAPKLPFATAAADRSGLADCDSCVLSADQCRAAAACAAISALPATAIGFIAPPAGVAPDSLITGSDVGFFTDGPDRPPRLTRA